MPTLYDFYSVPGCRKQAADWMRHIYGKVNGDNFSVTRNSPYVVVFCDRARKSRMEFERNDAQLVGQTWERHITDGKFHKSAKTPRFILRGQ